MENRIISYSKEDRQYILSEYKEVCGDNDSMAHVFRSNIFVKIDSKKSPLENYNFPDISERFGTYNYYEDNLGTVSNNYNTPDLRIDILNNQNTLSGNSYFSHNIYKIYYDNYKQLTGNTPTGNFNTVVNSITNPILNVTGNSQNINGNTYKIQYPVTITDSVNNFQSVDLFEDKCQYFITTETILDTYSLKSKFLDFKYYDQNNVLTDLDLSQNIMISANTIMNTITAGTFVNNVAKSDFFTYFITPNQPVIEPENQASTQSETDWVIGNSIGSGDIIKVEGPLNTFSPVFYFSNVEDGDRFTLEINYDINDPLFTGTKTVYNIPKVNSNIYRGTIRYISKMLNKNSSFWYRIGNIKEITNIFGYKDYSTTYSNRYSASTPSCQYDCNYYTLSGQLFGGVTDIATIELYDHANNLYLQNTSEADGGYILMNIAEGQYTLSVIYRGYKSETMSLYINSDEIINITMKLLWGNTFDTWGSKANDIPGI